MSFRALILKAAGLPPVKNMVTNGGLFKGMVRRFIAGETSAEAIQVAEGLAKEGFLVSLDLLGENVSSADEAGQSREAYLDLVEHISSSPFVTSINISIKLTALGLDQGDDVAEHNYRELVQRAAQNDIFVRADMEGSDYTQRTIDMVAKVFRDLPNTGTVLQSYLHRTDSDLERLMALGCRIRLVKGAYLEPPTVAFQDKLKVDDQYDRQARKMVMRANYPAIATHDEHVINRLVNFAEQHEIPKDRFEWQMLYGIRRDLQRRLLDQGYNVRVYVPYGKAWYPYFTRRLAERPANLFFIAKSMFKG